MRSQPTDQSSSPTDNKPVELSATSRHFSSMESGSNYLTTEEAAQYLRHSVSWLMRQGSIPYLRGRPNLYLKKDLDDWFQSNKYTPRLR